MNIQLQIEPELKNLIENAVKPLKDEIQNLKSILQNLEFSKDDELLTDIEVANLLKIGKSTVRDQLKKDPTFPKPKKIGVATRWRKGEIIEYMNKKN